MQLVWATGILQTANTRDPGQADSLVYQRLLSNAGSPTRFSSLPMRSWLSQGAGRSPSPIDRFAALKTGTERAKKRGEEPHETK